MPANIEIKARVADPARLRALVEEISGTPGRLLVQEDVFFAAPKGRLKLRTMEDGRSELIAYQRPDEAGPKLSEYTIATISKPESLRQILEKQLGVIGIVRKQRLLFLIGATRVHLDRVEGLGDFVELEVVLEPDQSTDDGMRIAREMMRRFDIEESALVAQAYLDLTLSASPTQTADTSDHVAAPPLSQ